MSLELEAMRQSVDRIAATQEQITRHIDELTTGQEQMTRNVDQLTAGREGMARDVDQITAGQEQIIRDITKPRGRTADPSQESRARLVAGSRFGTQPHAAVVAGTCGALAVRSATPALESRPQT